MKESNQMARKQYSNNILAKNGGLHSRRALKTVRQAMTTHKFKRPILYQIILSGKSTKKEYQATIKRLIEHIRTKCKAEYIGAYEVGSEKGGLHCHAFVIVETLDHFPGDDVLNVSAGYFIARRIALTGMSIKIAPPQNPMHDEQMFARMDTPAKLANCIDWATYTLKLRSKDAVPGREIYFGSCHAANARKREAVRQKYRDAVLKSSRPAPQAVQEASVATQTVPSILSVPRLEGQITLTEKESQDEGSVTEGICSTSRTSQDEAGSQDHASQENGTSTTESRSSRSGSSSLGRSRSWRAQDGKHGSSGPTGQAIWPGQSHGGSGSSRSETYQPITHNPGDAMTPADRYIASLYESAIGLRLNLDEVRAYLLAHGVKRTPAAVVHDLDEVYAFAGYTASHPAPAPVSTAVLDKIIDRMPDRDIKLLPIPTAWPYGRTGPRLIRVCPTEPMKLSHKVGSLGLTVCEPPFIIEPSTLLNQARSQA